MRAVKGDFVSLDRFDASVIDKPTVRLSILQSGQLKETSVNTYVYKKKQDMDNKRFEVRFNKYLGTIQPKIVLVIIRFI